MEGQKLFKEDVTEMLKLRRLGFTVKEISEKYGVSQQRVYQITSGVKLIQGKCRYCGIKVNKGTICSDCFKKLKLVRELLATANLIKEKAGRT